MEAQLDEPDFNPRSKKRWATPSERAPSERDDFEDARNFSRGCLFGLFLSIPLWVVIVGVIYWLVDRYYQ